MGNRTFSRREFMRTVGTATAGSYAANSIVPAALAAAEGKAKVAMAARDGSIVGNGVDKEVVAEMVHSAVISFTGARDRRAAWSSLFEPADVVGIKINPLGGPGITNRRETVDAMIEGLTLAGVPEGNILIWDRFHKHIERVQNLGYEINGGAGVKCYAADSEGISPGYDAAPQVFGGVKTWLTKILTERITALINAPVLKHHGMAGLTISLKNHLGSIKNPRDFHADHCVAVGDLNTASAIRQKTRIIICDALFGMCDGLASFRNPKDRFTCKKILVAKDPVALDTIGAQLIEEERKRRGLPRIGSRMKHVARAAELGLGTNDPNRIDVVEA